MACYDVFARFYDLFTDTVDYAKRAEYFHTILSSTLEGQILLLDLACGTGSLSLELAKRGYDVIGVDASAQMLMQAQQKAFDAGEQILFLQQPMEELDLYGTVRACVCALDSLNHLRTKPALELAISRVSLFLEPGGIFIFDMNTPYKHQEVLADNCFVYEQEGVLCLWQNHTEGLVTDITLDFFVREKSNSYRRYSEQFTEQAFLMQDIKEILASCGLKLLAVYGDDTVLPPCEETERWIFVTQKEK